MIDLDTAAPYELFANRDLTWLDFNRRVLALASDERTPLLERARFCAIFTNNLDEFFMKRVGLLKNRIRSKRSKTSHDGLTPKAQLAAIRTLVLSLLEEQSELWHNHLLPALAEQGIGIRSYQHLDAAERDTIDRWYRANVFPILTPLAVDPGHRFPFISNLSTSLGVLLQTEHGEEPRFARVKIPSTLPQLVRIDEPDAAVSTGRQFVTLDDVIANNLDDLFPEAVLKSALTDTMTFRVTRSAAVAVDDDEADDLLDVVEEELRARRFSEAVRLQLPAGASGPLVDYLREELDLHHDDIYTQSGLIDFTDLFQIADLDRPELRDTPWKPLTHPELADADADIFSIIRRHDVLVHHPYHSFRTSVERFIRAAADDPKVQAIKITLYRTSPDSPFVSSLIRAAESGKQVACLVEVRARFDEQRNVQFARQLENAGVHVAYGVVGLKTHCKTALVVRKEDDGLRAYCHIGTGNYHPHTAQLYTDLGLFTADPTITDDVVDLFNALTTGATERHYNALVVAPHFMRSTFVRLIDEEIANAKAGKPSRIIAKMNQLEDPEITRKLYEASQAGVPINLYVRGFCSLRPGVPGLSDTINVTSIIGRFLEHARLFHFAGGSADPLDGHYFMSSADWMYRNLSNRVEAAAPVNDRRLKAELWHLFETHRRDRRNAWRLLPDGSSTPVAPNPDADPDSPEARGTFETMMRTTVGG